MAVHKEAALTVTEEKKTSLNPLLPFEIGYQDFSRAPHLSEEHTISHSITSLTAVSFRAVHPTPAEHTRNPILQPESKFEQKKDLR